MQPNESVLKAMAENQQQARSRVLGEDCGVLGTGKLYRPTMRDRLKCHIVGIEEQHGKLEKMNELFALLEKNPDIARILELVEELGV
jgi:hypothetical protein